MNQVSSFNHSPPQTKTNSLLQYPVSTKMHVENVTALKSMYLIGIPIISKQNLLCVWNIIPQKIWHWCGSNLGVLPSTSSLSFRCFQEIKWEDANKYSS